MSLEGPLMQGSIDGDGWMVEREREARSVNLQFDNFQNRGV